MQKFNWKKISTAPQYQEFYQELKDLCKYDELETNIQTYEAYSLYKKIGDRTAYETPYHRRRRRLSSLVIMYLSNESEEYLTRIQNLIWEICNEYVWAVPAHISGAQTDGERRAIIDLFAAQTGFDLSETYNLIGDKLDEEVKERIKSEIKLRIVDKFISGKFWWEEAKMNWASVCAGFVGATFINMFPELFPKVRERIDGAMKSFISGFNNDGACLEGVSYWFYGFGLFCLYHDYLSRVDKTALDIFKDEKIHNISRFYTYACLEDAIALTFADCQPNARYDIATMFFLRGIYGDEIKIPPVKYRILMDRCSLYTTKNLFERYNPAEVSDGIDNFKHVFPDSEMYSMKNSKFSFAAKGGHNDEPHNHNDVGSFLVVRGGEQLLCDIGVGFYNKDYFNDNIRYTMIGNGSHGHSVPIVNGKYQLAGKEYRATDVSISENEISMDIAKAYGISGHIYRNFKIGDDSIVLHDSFELEQAESIIERFVSYVKPEIKDGLLVWNGMQLKFDGSALECSISSEKYKNNFKGIFDVWLIDLKVKNPAEKCDFEFEIKMV